MERREEIRAELKSLSPEIDQLAIAEIILERVWSGEWLGHGMYFYVDDLAELLTISVAEAFRIVNRLKEKQIVGLNGFIIIPWQEDQKVLVSREARTGHKALRLGELSNAWECEFCGQMATGIGPAPQEVPCIIGKE